MKTIILLLLAIQAGAQTIRTSPPNGIGSATTYSSVTITGTGSQCLYVSSSGATNPALMVDCANARTGIGTSSPAEPLQVRSNATGDFVRLWTNADGGNILDIGVDTTNKRWYFSPDGSATTYDITFRANGGADMVRFDQSTGFIRLGAGAADPTSLVHMSSGTLLVDGAGSYMRPPAWTLAQIRAATPTGNNIGAIVTCTDCASAHSVCQATGTIGGFRLGTTGTSACQ